MDKIRCLVVDDEPFTVEILTNEISKFKELNLIQTCPSADEALRILELIDIDLIFLDVQMPGLSGLQLISQLQKPPLVILTTAFERFAVAAFELNVVDYLLKPIPFKRLVSAVNKAYSLHQLKTAQTNPSLGNRKGILYVKSKYKTIKILHADILYIEGMKDYVKIFTTTRTNPILTRMNVKGIQSLLPSDLFCRVHQSYIVSIAKVEKFQKKKLWISQKEIPIGERFPFDFKNTFTS